MSWDAIGAIGQMLGSVAVFVTLVYLAAQVSYAKEEMRRSVSQSRADGLRELAINRANNQQLSSSLAKAQAGLSGGSMNTFVMTLIERCGLTVEEAYGLHWEQLAYWHHRVQVTLYIDEMTAAARTDQDRVFRRTYGGDPVARLWYESAKSTLGSNAVRYVDNLLAQPG